MKKKRKLKQVRGSRTLSNVEKIINRAPRGDYNKNNEQQQLCRASGRPRFGGGEKFVQ